MSELLGDSSIGDDDWERFRVEQAVFQGYVTLSQELYPDEPEAKRLAWARGAAREEFAECGFTPIAQSLPHQWWLQTLARRFPDQGRPSFEDMYGEGGLN